MKKFGKICWVITGAGHFLAETCDFLTTAGVPADIYFTRAGLEVARRYRQIERVEGLGLKIFHENDFSSSGLVFFAGGRYDALVIAPATSNTVAKCVLGIADSLASNFFAQAGKSLVPIFVLPTDTDDEMVSITPSGRLIPIRPRLVDMIRLEELGRFPGVTALRSPGELSVLI